MLQVVPHNNIKMASLSVVVCGASDISVSGASEYLLGLAVLSTVLTCTMENHFCCMPAQSTVGILPLLFRAILDAVRHIQGIASFPLHTRMTFDSTRILVLSKVIHVHVRVHWGEPGTRLYS